MQSLGGTRPGAYQIPSYQIALMWKRIQKTAPRAKETN